MSKTTDPSVQPKIIVASSPRLGDSPEVAYTKYNRHTHQAAAPSSFWFYPIQPGDTVSLRGEDGIDAFGSDEGLTEATVLSITEDKIELNRSARREVTTGTLFFKSGYVPRVSVAEGSNKARKGRSSSGFISTDTLENVLRHSNAYHFSPPSLSEYVLISRSTQRVRLERITLKAVWVRPILGNPSLTFSLRGQNQNEEVLYLIPQSLTSESATSYSLGKEDLLDVDTNLELVCSGSEGISALSVQLDYSLLMGTQQPQDSEILTFDFDQPGSEGSISPAVLDSIEELQVSVESKAPLQHWHSLSDVTGLRQILDNTVDSSDLRLSNARIPLEHWHSLSEIRDLQSALDLKTDTTDLRLTNERIPRNSSVTDLKVAADAAIAWSKISKAGATISDLGLTTTDGLFEGTTNLYFTQARARAAFTPGSNITITNGVISSTGGGSINLSAPGAIGNTTPSTGNFTNLTATTFSVNGTNVAFTNDTRFTDARIPLDHTQAISTITGLVSLLDTKSNWTDTRFTDTRVPTDASVTNAKVATNAAIAWSKIDKSGATASDIGLTNTNSLPEGTNNLYFTQARARAAFTPGSNIAISNGVISVAGGVSVDLSSPAPIGNTTPNTGSFTTLTVSNSFSVGGISVALTNDARLSDARTPLTHNQPWSTITATPTTLVGYGITDAVGASDSRLADARTPLVHNQAWSTITATPTTLAEYGITNGVLTSDSRLTDARIPLAHNQAWSTITGTPTTLAGYGITNAVASDDARLTDARTPLAHNQAWSTITLTPTTLSGYGITDAVSSSDARLTNARVPTDGSVSPTKLTSGFALPWTQVSGSPNFAVIGSSVSFGALIVTGVQFGASNPPIFDQQTAPASPVVGTQWTERDGSWNIITTWVWDGTRWVFRLNGLTGPTGIALTGASTRGWGVPTISFGTGILIRSITLKGRANTANHSASSFLNFIHVLYVNSSTSTTNIGTNQTTQTLVTTANTNIAITPNQLVPWADFNGLGTNFSSGAGTPSFNYRMEAVIDVYR